VLKKKDKEEKKEKIKAERKRETNKQNFNPLNPELNPICCLLAL